MYYGEVGDSLNYFHDAGKLFELGRQDAGAYWNVIVWNEYTPIWDTKLMLWQEPRAFWFVKLISLLMWIVGNNYWLLACYFSFLSFVGSWYLVEALSKTFPTTRLWAVGSFLFFPSVVFFGSGLTKESLSIALLGWGTAQALKVKDLRSFIYFGLVAIVCAWGLAQLKFYYLAFWAGGIGTHLLAYQIVHKTNLPAWGYVVVFVGVCVLGVFLSSFVFDFDTLVLMTVLNHNTTYVSSQPQDLIHYSIHGGQGYISLNASWISLFYNAPIALEAGLFRPYVWEASDKLKFLMSLENLGVLGLAICAVVLIFWKGLPKLSKEEVLFSCAVLMYVVGLLIIVALASPNMGALVRYKVVTTGWVVYGLGCMIKASVSKIVLSK